MPDWSYHTLLRPLFFTLSPETAHRLTLRFAETLGATPTGQTLIDLFGHMKPPQSSACSLLGLKFPGRVGLGGGFDSDGIALKAFSHFGFGFLEIGPVTPIPFHASEKIIRLPDALLYPSETTNEGVDALVKRLENDGRSRLPLAIRLASIPDASLIETIQHHRDMIRQLSKYAHFFTLDIPPQHWQNYLTLMMKDMLRPLVLCIQPEDMDIERFLTPALDAGIHGVLIKDEKWCGDNQRYVGPENLAPALEMTRCLRQIYGEKFTIIASGGIHTPQDALWLLEAGADLIQIHSGFIFSGPGLPKRINEAVAYPPKIEKATSLPLWMPVTFVALVLIISGIIVWWVAIHEVVLPYDEAFVSMTRAQLSAINDRLLSFMMHDRVTLAGTMISTGILYLGLALAGVRQGWHWAKRTFLVSCFVGMLSFFLFIGFGYFDPLHAFLTSLLVPAFIMSLRLPLVTEIQPPLPNLTNNPRWKIGQWGQALFVTIGFGLVLAGTTIVLVGTVNTFVPQDLEFLNTTAEALDSANPRLISLIAHDRVGFGGNLIANGLAVLLISLWGFRQGARWIWWTLCGAGLPGFIAALGIHISVGYLNFIHVLPAIVAFVLYLIALAVSFPFLFTSEY